jgi:hypothetical protein
MGFQLSRNSRACRQYRWHNVHRDLLRRRGGRRKDAFLGTQMAWIWDEVDRHGLGDGLVMRACGLIMRAY